MKRTLKEEKERMVELMEQFNDQDQPSFSTDSYVSDTTAKGYNPNVDPEDKIMIQRNTEALSGELKDIITKYIAQVKIQPQVGSGENWERRSLSELNYLKQYITGIWNTVEGREVWQDDPNEKIRIK